MIATSRIFLYVSLYLDAVTKGVDVPCNIEITDPKRTWLVMAMMIWK